jgi:hypothetical protein
MAAAFLINAGAGWLSFFDILWQKKPEFRIQKPEDNRLPQLGGRGKNSCLNKLKSP